MEHLFDNFHTSKATAGPPRHPDVFMFQNIKLWVNVGVFCLFGKCQLLLGVAVAGFRVER